MAGARLHTLPLYKYSFCSVSNIASSACQYEALKYVSFPVQTLAKCAKMMPVLFWGTIMSGKRYKVADYAAAVVVTLSCTLFLLESAARRGRSGIDGLDRVRHGPDGVLP